MVPGGGNQLTMTGDLQEEFLETISVELNFEGWVEP